DPEYWAKHLRRTVRFGEGIKEVLKNRESILLEVGPGTSLRSLAGLQLEGASGRAIYSSLRHVREERPDGASVLTTLGDLWLEGVKVDWKAFKGREGRQRVS